MLGTEQVEELICLLASWPRAAVLDSLLDFKARFPVDFTHEFLSQLSTDRLRHLYLALCLQHQRMPYAPAVAA
jgi:hypothetical protein